MKRPLYLFFINLTWAFAEEPHCSTEAVMQSHLDPFPENASEAGGWSTQFLLSLNDTSCFVTTHALKFVRVEHHYGIGGSYQFGIPIIRQNCLCDCQGSEEICKAEDYQYKNCSSGSLCYRTLRPHQSNVGCVSSGKSDVCCEVQLDPYQGWRFQAIQLKQPDTVYVLHYKVYHRKNKKWHKTFEKELNFALNKGMTSTDLDLDDQETVGIEVTAGRPHRQMEPGMYFWKVEEKGEDKLVRGNVRLNEPDENSLEKLGWFRFEQNRWTVRRGLEKITKAQHIQVENCKAQRYMLAFDAEQFVLETGQEKHHNFVLGNVTAEVNPWVQSIRVRERVVEVAHSEGSALAPGIFRHISQLGDFSGSIHLDSSSNCYMNLTFRVSQAIFNAVWQDVRGPLQGEVYTDSSRTHAELFFSVQVGDQLESFYRAVVPLPASVDSDREVCIQAYGDAQSRECRRLLFLAEPLHQPFVGPLWASDQSECVGCNERGVEAFILNLDPRRWLDGLNSRMEVAAFGVETAILVAAAFILIVLFSKVLIPIFCCLKWCCTPSYSSRKRKDQHDHLILEKF